MACKDGLVMLTRTYMWYEKRKPLRFCVLATLFLSLFVGTGGCPKWTSSKESNLSKGCFVNDTGFTRFWPFDFDEFVHSIFGR